MNHFILMYNENENIVWMRYKTDNGYRYWNWLGEDYKEITLTSCEQQVKEHSNCCELIEAG